MLSPSETVRCSESCPQCLGLYVPRDCNEDGGLSLKLEEDHRSDRIQTPCGQIRAAFSSPVGLRCASEPKHMTVGVNDLKFSRPRMTPHLAFYLCTP